MSKETMSAQLSSLPSKVSEVLEAELATAKAVSRETLAKVLSSEFPDWSEKDLMNVCGVIVPKLGYGTKTGKHGGYCRKESAQ